MKAKVISFLFCGLLAAGTLSGLIAPDKQYSASEKRTLAQWADISLEDFFSGKLGDALEEYLADQFPGRDAWVTVKTLAERLTGKQESGGVYFADDGYLIEAHTSFSEKRTASNLAAVKKLQDALAPAGIPLQLMPVPTAGDVLSDKLPAFAPEADQQAVIRQAEAAGICVVDVTEALSAHKDEYIYYKTDHHWTSLGAYYAYAEWCGSLGRSPEPLSAWQTEILCEDFRGTTYAKVNDPFAAYDTIQAFYKTLSHPVDYNRGNYITDSIYERSYLEGSDPYAVFLNSNQAVTVVSAGGEGRLLILKDSYANTFAQFCIDDYAETHLIDLRFFRGSVTEYIEESGITRVLVLYNIPNFTDDTGLMKLNIQS